MSMPEPCRAVPCRAWLTAPSVGRGQPGGSRGVPEPWEGAGSGRGAVWGQELPASHSLILCYGAPELCAVQPPGSCSHRYLS